MCVLCVCVMCPAREFLLLLLLLLLLLVVVLLVVVPTRETGWRLVSGEKLLMVGDAATLSWLGS